MAGFFVCLAIAAGCLAAGVMTGAWVLWRRRQRVLGRRPAQDSYGPGGWFAVPLPRSAGFAPGLITSAEPRQDGILLCHFFPPDGIAVPALDQLRELSPADAILIAKLDGLSKKWPKLGQEPGWDRGAWPVPAFRQSVEQPGQPVTVRNDDDLRFIRQEPADREELDALPADDLLTSVGVETRLAELLGKSPQAAAPGAGPQALDDGMAGRGGGS